MPPKFRVLAGPNSHSLSLLEVNTDSTDASTFFKIKTDDFEGRVVGNIKGFVNADGNIISSKYFDRDDRKKEGTTWSIQVQGRFLKPISANNVMFGNTFDRPLMLPWGSSAALQFASFVDPVLTHDLYSERPWALSPFVSTMPHFKAVSHPATSPLPSFDPLKPFDEDVSILIGGATTPPTPLITASKRRKWFEKESRRISSEFTPNVVFQADFAYGYFQFPELVLAIPGGLTFDLKKYWDKQPVRFVCCERGEHGPGKELFVIVFEVPEYEQLDEEEKVEEDDVDLDEGDESPPPSSANAGHKLADDID